MEDVVSRSTMIKPPARLLRSRSVYQKDKPYKIDRIEQNSRIKLPNNLEKKESSSEKFFWGIEREFQAWKKWFCSEIFSSTSPRRGRRPRHCACRSLTGWLAGFSSLPDRNTLATNDERKRPKRGGKSAQNIHPTVIHTDQKSQLPGYLAEKSTSNRWMNELRHPSGMDVRCLFWMDGWIFMSERVTGWVAGCPSSTKHTWRNEQWTEKTKT